MKIFLVLLFFLFSAFGFSACPRSADSKPCKGECGAFIDSDKNGVCDEWEKNRALAGKEILKKTLSPPQNPTSADEKNEAKLQKKGFKQKISKYGLDKTLIAILLVIILCQLLKKKYSYRKVHNDLWNSILFLSFFSCALSGIFLYFSFFPSIKYLLFKIHLFSGFISFFAGIYHYLERFRCMFPFRKYQ